MSASPPPCPKAAVPLTATSRHVGFAPMPAVPKARRTSRKRTFGAQVLAPELGGKPPLPTRPPASSTDLPWQQQRVRRLARREGFLRRAGARAEPEDAALD